jgi:predicted HicB family RNase H-like nuclease
MTDRTRPSVTADSPIGPDVDLEEDDVRLADRTRLTEQRAAEIVEEVRGRGGRPSLTGEAAVSPRIAFRVTPGVRNRAAQIAAREGKTISQLAREALEARVAREPHLS